MSSEHFERMEISSRCRRRNLRRAPSARSCGLLRCSLRRSTYKIEGEDEHNLRWYSLNTCTYLFGLFAEASLPLLAIFVYKWHSLLFSNQTVVFVRCFDAFTWVILRDRKCPCILAFFFLQDVAVLESKSSIRQIPWAWQIRCSFCTSVLGRFELSKLVS